MWQNQQQQPEPQTTRNVPAAHVELHSNDCHRAMGDASHQWKVVQSTPQGTGYAQIKSITFGCALGDTACKARNDDQIFADDAALALAHRDWIFSCTIPVAHDLE
jgi:hypothetical protein